MSKEAPVDKYLVEHYSAIGGIDTDFRNKNLFELVARYVSGESVLDIGCGLGFFAKILHKRGKSVLGMEPSEGMRKLAAELNPEVRIVEEASGVFDTVTMLDVLEHIEDDAKQAKIVHSMLKDKGEFVLVVPAYPGLYGERDKHMGHYRRYTKQVLRKVLEDGGFEVKSMRYWNALGILPYLVSEKILRKPLQSKLRERANLGQKMLDLWFRWIENHFDFGCGLSIICVAKKI